MRNHSLNLRSSFSAVFLCTNSSIPFLSSSVKSRNLSSNYPSPENRRSIFAQYNISKVARLPALAHTLRKTVIFGGDSSLDRLCLSLFYFLQKYLQAFLVHLCPVIQP